MWIFTGFFVRFREGFHLEFHQQILHSQLRFATLRQYSPPSGTAVCRPTPLQKAVFLGWSLFESMYLLLNMGNFPLPAMLVYWRVTILMFPFITGKAKIVKDEKLECLLE